MPVLDEDTDFRFLNSSDKGLFLGLQFVLKNPFQFEGGSGSRHCFLEPVDMAGDDPLTIFEEEPIGGGKNGADST